MEKKYYLLTGVTGTLGSHMLYELLDKHINNTKIKFILVGRSKKNISFLERVNNLFKNEVIPEFLKKHDLNKLKSLFTVLEIDFNSENLNLAIENILPNNHKLTIIHCAATLNLLNTEKAKQENYTVNYQGTMNLFNQLKGKFDKFIYISTIFSCGEMSGYTNDNYLDKKNTKFRSHYERYKYLIEKRINNICKKENIQLQILRPSIISGRLMDYPYYYIPNFDHFYLFGMFFETMRKKNHNEKVRIFINKDGGLNIIPVDYAAKIVVNTIETNVKELNIVHSKNTPHNFYLAKILEMVGYNNYEFVSEKPTNLNSLEIIYYNSIGSAITPYVNVDVKYETEGVKSIKKNKIPEPAVIENFEGLINFAIERNFS